MAFIFKQWGGGGMGLRAGEYIIPHTSARDDLYFIPEVLSGSSLVENILSKY